MKQLIIAACTD